MGEGVCRRSTQSLYSGATGRGHPLGLARVPGVSLGFLWFSLILLGFPCISVGFLGFQSLCFSTNARISKGFQSLCFSGLFLLTVA